MLQDVENVLRVGVDRARDFLGRFSSATGKFLAHIILKLQQSCRRLLSRFHARLMVGVDVNERSVKANRAFLKRDQCANVDYVSFRNAHLNRFASFLVKRGAASTKKPMQVISAGNCGLDLERGTMAILRHCIKRDKEM